MSTNLPACRHPAGLRPPLGVAALHAALLTLLMLLNGPAAAAPDSVAHQSPLDLDAAMTLAETRSRALPAAQLAARAARERAVAAGQRPDPVMRFGVDNLPVEGSPDRALTREPTTARSIGIVQALPNRAKRQARSLRFEQDARVALSRRTAQRAEVRREAALAWWRVHTQLQQLLLLDALNTEALLTQQAAEAAFRAGTGSPADVFAARSLPARLGDQRLQVQSQLATARSALRRWVGDAADAPLAGAPVLTANALGDDPQSALDKDPTLLGAAAAEDRARALVDLAREEGTPDWSVDLRFQQRALRYDNMVTIGFSLPLRWDAANRQDRETAARAAEVQQAVALTEELRRSRAAEVDSWQQRWRLGLDRLAGYDQQLLPLAASRTQAALASYSAGNGALAAVLQARQAELALRLERVQIELDVATDWTRLNTLIPPPEATP